MPYRLIGLSPASYINTITFENALRGRTPKAWRGAALVCIPPASQHSSHYQSGRNAREQAAPGIDPSVSNSLVSGVNASKALSNCLALSYARELCCQPLEVGLASEARSTTRRLANAEGRRRGRDEAFLRLYPCQADIFYGHIIIQTILRAFAAITGFLYSAKGRHHV